MANAIDTGSAIRFRDINTDNLFVSFSLRFVILPETKFYQKKRGCYAARYFF